MTKEEVSADTSLEIWLELPDNREPFYTTGHIVWSQMVKPKKYMAGVKLDNIDLMGMSRILRAVKAT